MKDNVTPLATPKVQQLQYILLSGSTAGDSLVSYHDSAYQLWRRSWLKTFEDLKSDHTLRADDFTRHDIVAGLFFQGNAVSLLLHTRYDLELEAVRDHSYVTNYPPSIIETLRAEGKRQVLSMEYLTLDRAWRRSVIGIPLAEIIVGLSARIAMESGLTSVQVARADRGINEILYGYGARCLASDIKKHNVAVELVALDAKDVHFRKDESVRRWIDYFWARRVDATGSRPEAHRPKIA